MLRIPLIVVGALLLMADILNSQGNSDHDPWYFTAEEMEVVYRYQEMFGERIQHPLRGRDCLFGKEEFVASYRGKEFLVSCRFIKETIRHLKEMLEVGAAKYLFPLDLDHAHLAAPADLWRRKYSKLPGDILLPALLEEPTLAALYHTAEHLTLIDPKTGKVNPKDRAWKEKRNVLGFYDGRPIEILPPDPKGSGVNVPKPYSSFGGFNFLASPKGELVIFVGNQAIAFDITFDIGVEEFSFGSLPKKPAKSSSNLVGRGSYSFKEPLNKYRL